MWETSNAGFFNVSATALRAHQARLEAIAHNLANASTAGFKRTQLLSADLGYDRLQPGAPEEYLAGDLLQGAGTVDLSFGRVFSQGAIIPTGRDLDVAIDGEGFLAVQWRDGTTAYTRDGALNVDADGRLVTSTGLLLDPPITLPADAVVVGISDTGEVLASVAGGDPEVVGRLTLARFDFPSALLPVGDNCYQPTPASGEPIGGVPGEGGLGLFVSGCLEQANLDLAGEMTSLMAAQRAYQMSARALQAADQMLSQADDIAGQ